MLVFTAMVYLRGLVSRRSRIPTWRACGFLIGLFLIWATVASPLSALDHQLLTVHMLKHLLLMTVAPPLIWLGEPLRAWLQDLPRFVRGARGVAFRWPVTIVIRTGKALARPEVCWVGSAATLVGWHIPPVFTLAMHSAGWHCVEQSSFLATGLLFWWPVAQPWPRVPKSGLWMILYLFFATLPCDILSGFLVFCDRVVYPVYLPSSHLFGFTALGDQQCAAALMWTCVTVIYLVAAAILAMRLLSPQNSCDDEFVMSDVHPKAAQRGVQQSLEACEHGDETYCCEP
jgi:cytochrome c oxidase assembly factor CtaG